MMHRQLWSVVCLLSFPVSQPSLVVGKIIQHQVSYASGTDPNNTWECLHTSRSEVERGLRSQVTAPQWNSSADKENLRKDERQRGDSSYHDEASGDQVVAAVAQLAKFGPIVLLAEEVSIFFIVPVGQRGAAFTAPIREHKRSIISL